MFLLVDAEGTFITKSNSLVLIMNIMVGVTMGDIKEGTYTEKEFEYTGGYYSIGSEQDMGPWNDKVKV